MKRVSPAVDRIEERERAPPALVGAGISIETALLAVGLDGVEVSEIFERDGGSCILGEEGRVEFGADVHSAAKPSIVWNDDHGLAVVVLDLTRVAGVAMALDEAVNGGEPCADFSRLPAWRVAVGDCFGTAGRAVSANEAPEMVTKCAVFARLVERFEV